MDHPANFVTQFAQLVRLVESRADVAAQKTALRGCLVALKRGAIALSVLDGALLVGGMRVAPDSGAALLAARIGPLGIDSLVFEAGAAPSDVLAAARWLVDSATPDAGRSAVLSGLRTVRVEPLAPAEAEPDAAFEAAPEADPATKAVRRRSGLTLAIDSPPTPRRKSGTTSTIDTPPRARRKSGATSAIDTPPRPRRGSGTTSTIDTPPRPRRGSGTTSTIDTPPRPRRKSGITSTIDSSARRKSGMVAVIDFDAPPRNRANDLLDVLDRAGGAPERQRAVDDVVAGAELAVREGELEVVADAAFGLFSRQGQARGDEMATLCASALPRLLTPTALRLLAQAAARMRPRADSIQLVLAHAGEEGAAAVISQVILAPTLTDRRLHFEMMLKLPSAVPALCRMLGAEQWQVARNAAQLLGELHASEAQAALAGALQHEDERVRRAVAHALAGLGTPAAVQALRGALADPSALVRVQAANGLANRKGAKSATTLAQALEGEGDAEVQLTIIAALGRLGTTEAVNRLIRAAEPDGRLFRKKPVTFRVAAVHALGEVRTAGARAALQSLATDKDRKVREAVLRVVMQAPRDHGDRGEQEG